MQQPKEFLLVNTGDSSNPISAGQAILNGYAPGSELYTYAEYPTISHSELVTLLGQSYAEIFYQISKKFLGSDIPDSVLRATADEAYSLDNFDFDAEDGNLQFTTLPSGVFVVGLSDGPTGAFKDMAMQPFARWMSYLQSQAGKPLTILLSTSGDTGPAALKAFGGLANTEIINMLPKQGVSPFQWAQMAATSGNPGVHVLEVDGDFSYINDLHMEADLAYDLGAVNSVNVARIIAQIPYYVAAYLKAINKTGRGVGDPVDVSVPSGNFGNALAGIIARKMGLPLRRIIIATNENNTLTGVINDGVFRLTDFQHTDSSAQDVRMPSNIWRYFAMLYGNDTAKISQVYQTLQNQGSVNLASIGIVDETLPVNIAATTITANERHLAMQEVYRASNSSIIIDPHTANGVAAIDKLNMLDSNVPMLALETAKPFKFDTVIEQVLGVTPPRPERFQNLENTTANKQLVQIADAKELLAYLRDHTAAKAK